MKIFPMANKIYQSSSKFLRNSKYTLPPPKKIAQDCKDSAKVAKFRQIWSHCQALNWHRLMYIVEGIGWDVPRYKGILYLRFK